MQGYSGTYGINGTQISQPESGKWSQRQTLGVDGNNQVIYPTVREFELTWNLMSTSELATLINFSLASQTGTLVVDLPKWGDSNYIWFSYSGTRIREPVVGEYFGGYSGFATDVHLLIVNIRTN